MPQTILIVDDEKRLVSLVQSYLMQEGYRVFTAYNGKDALPVAQKEKPDLIILDIMMPDLNGIEALKEVSAKKKDTLKKIIITTNASDMEFLSEALELGVSSYFLKSNMSLENIFATAEEKVAQVIL